MPKKSRTNGSRKQRRTAPIRRAQAAKSIAPRRVRSLQKFLKAYGNGSDANRMRVEFAKRVPTTLPYLVHLAYGYRTASVELAAQIERHTHGLVRCEEMRPDIDWNYLATRKASRATTLH